MTFIKGLTVIQKSIILDEFINNIEKAVNKNGGFIIGSTQIIKDLEKISVSYGFNECPYCKRKI